MRSVFNNRKIVSNIFKGFTLIEILLVLAIIGVMSSVLVITINPQRQLAKARDTERKTDIYSILASVYQYQAEHSGAIPDTDGDPLTSNFPTSATCIGTDVGCFDLGGAGGVGETIVPVYMADMPKDPKLVSTGQPATDGNSGYTIYIDANNRLHASAVGEIENPITITR